MKLILPLEHRIQQKGEKYGDDELIRDAIEVSELRKELEAQIRANHRGTVIEVVMGLVLFALAYWAFK